MQRLRLILLATGFALLPPVAADAQSLSVLDGLRPADRRAYLESMSPDERTAMRGEWRAEVAAMADEERAAHREQRRENKGKRREKWQSMSEEERAAARQQMAARKHGAKAEKRHGGDGTAG